MAVCIDGLHDWGWAYGKSCHLVADTVEELHAFAERCGLRRRWFQVSRSGIPHYDLTANRRLKALRLGAVDCGDDRERFMAVVDRAGVPLVEDR